MKGVILVFVLFAVIGATVLLVFNIDIVATVTSFMQNPTEYLATLPAKIGETVSQHLPVLVSVFGTLTSSLLFFSNRVRQLQDTATETQTTLQSQLQDLSAAKENLEKQHEEDVAKITQLQNTDTSDLKKELDETQKLVVTQQDRIRSLEIERNTLTRALDEKRVEDKVQKALAEAKKVK